MYLYIVYHHNHRCDCQHCNLAGLFHGYTWFGRMVADSWSQGGTWIGVFKYDFHEYDSRLKGTRQ